MYKVSLTYCGPKSLHSFLVISNCSRYGELFTQNGFDLKQLLKSMRMPGTVNMYHIFCNGKTFK